MEYAMEELVPIVAELARKYAGCDSTSVTYETAQKLMQGVLYCLEEYQRAAEHQLCSRDTPVQARYEAGHQLVLEKTRQVMDTYNGIQQHFDWYGNKCLFDTVQKGIPEFLKWYDAKFFPQNTLLTLDYPILQNIQNQSGVDAVHTLILSVRYEQCFLNRLPREYVIAVLKQASLDYEEMIENIAGIVLANTLGHLAIDKPLADAGFTREDYGELTTFFAARTKQETEALLKRLIGEMLRQMGIDDEKVFEYLCLAVPDLAIRIENAVENGCMETLFVV
ncbi:MAG: DUF6179 domain-containing protein [Lachnospiraceae bacterium]|nr:DUF6179 domain-containing protein [Lachnospiraceae bacterium]